MTELNADVKRLLDRPNYAHMATLLPDGAPHTVPVWIAREEEDLVILTGPGSRKARNTERDPRVAISLIDVDQPYAAGADPRPGCGADRWRPGLGDHRPDFGQVHRPALSAAERPDRLVDQG